MILNDIKPIGIALKNFKTETVKLLYKLIYDDDDEEFTRKRVRNFCGFTFSTDSEECSIKLKDIQKKFSYNEIVTISNILNISIEANKSELCKNILSLLTNLNELLTAASGANETDSENETNDSSMQADSMGKNLDLEINKMHVDNGSQNKIIYVNSNVNVNFSDIENTISKFNAEPHENINNWIKHFENIAELFCLSNLQKFVFAKRSLGGIAKLFIQTELQINSWEKLKQALIDEFSLEINSALLHELLRNRKIRDCETTSEYFLKMKELCNIREKLMIPL
ncbi:transposon Ty3-G Gag-Pol polyprotein [Trichonephila clavipes]|nr:transposon Ty3-G Gag-Pol polyprotein [Trichonephila clavipes]